MATKNKYDRQLRLWGENGQRALSETCIVLINATAAGSETLKNLVLPGIGSFHVIDDEYITSDSPFFSNFFAFHHSTSLDNNERKILPRAEITCKNLSELNPDVEGKYTHVESLSSLFATVTTDSSSTDDNRSSIDNHPIHTLFQSIRMQHPMKRILVIASDLPPSVLRPLARYCWNGCPYSRTVNKEQQGDIHLSTNNIPLVIVHSYGLLGTVRVQVLNHFVMESKPSNSNPDLRLASTSSSTFPELMSFADSIDLESLDDKDHGHVPYVIILLKALHKWRSDTSSQDNCVPTSPNEKLDFVTIIKSMSRNYGEEMNFQEAVKNAHLAYTTKEIPDEIQQLMDTAKNEIFQSPSVPIDTIQHYHVLLFALSKYLTLYKFNLPPLDGAIPDMTSSTKYFIELQNVYKNKSIEEKEKISSIIDEIIKTYNLGADIISKEILSVFCKNIYNLSLISTRSYESEYLFHFKDDDERQDISSGIMFSTFEPYSEPDHTPLLWYIALRACHSFHDKYGFYPGGDSRPSALESDAHTVQKLIVQLVDQLNLSDNDLIRETLLSQEEDKKNVFAKEVVRYHNAEIHNIGSIVGGIASQEAVKLITSQYTPINGTYVYNGIVGVGGVLIL